VRPSALTWIKQDAIEQEMKYIGQDIDLAKVVVGEIRGAYTHRKIVEEILVQGLVRSVREAELVATEWIAKGIRRIANSQADMFSAEEELQKRCGTLRRHLRKQLPGVAKPACRASNPDEVSKSEKESNCALNCEIVHGDAIALRTAGLWLSAVGGGNCIGLGDGKPSRVLLSQLNEDANFHVVTSDSYQNLHSEDQEEILDECATVVRTTSFDFSEEDALGLWNNPEDVKSRSGVLRYGDYIWLQSSGGKSWRVQIICPGKSGPIHNGDHVMVATAPKLSVAQKAWWSTHIKSSKPRVVTGRVLPPAIFTIHANHGPAPSRSLPHSARSMSTSFSVVSYSVWMEQPRLAALFGIGGGSVCVKRKSRAKLVAHALAQSLKGRTLDAVVITHATCQESLGILRDNLRDQFGLYFESIVGDGAGIAILSRYEILRAFFQPFRTSSSVWEGFVHACIRKDGRNVHVVSVDLQRGKSDRADKTRVEQLEIIHKFVRDLRLPRTDLVLYTGSLNICKLQEPSKFEQALAKLCAVDFSSQLQSLESDAQGTAAPPLTYRPNKQRLSKSSSASALPHLEMLYAQQNAFRHYTSDPTTNQLVGAASQSGALDHVLVSQLHDQPHDARVKVLRSTRADLAIAYRGRHFSDLSDRYPVFAEIFL